MKLHTFDKITATDLKEIAKPDERWSEHCQNRAKWEIVHRVMKDQLQCIEELGEINLIEGQPDIVDKVDVQRIFGYFKSTENL